MSENFQYFKFMTDIIDSGTWAKLSSTAKSLYPVLLKFSDQTFKHVWPSTETLMRLTGFKTKKSVIIAKKELMEVGLIRTVPGTGRTNSKYYFSFNYEGSKITPLSNKIIYPTGIQNYTPEDHHSIPQGDSSVSPNNINITITNNPDRSSGTSAKNKSKKSSDTQNKLGNNTVDYLIEVYGVEIFNHAYLQAQKQDLENDLDYIRKACKSRIFEISKIANNIEDLSTEHIDTSLVWKNFLIWAEQQLTQSSFHLIKDLEPIVDGKTIVIRGELNKNLQQVITKYFSEKSFPKMFVSFLNKKMLNNNYENRAKIIG